MSWNAARMHDAGSLVMSEADAPLDGRAELRLGELLDRSITIYVKHWRAFVVPSVLAAVPYWLPTALTLGGISTTGQPWWPALSYAANFSLLFGASLAVVAVSPLARGRSAGIDRALARINRRWPPNAMTIAGTAAVLWALQWSSSTIWGTITVAFFARERDLPPEFFAAIPWIGAAFRTIASTIENAALLFSVCVLAAVIDRGVQPLRAILVAAEQVGARIGRALGLALVIALLYEVLRQAQAVVYAILPPARAPWFVLSAVAIRLTIVVGFTVVVYAAFAEFATRGAHVRASEVGRATVE